MCHDAVKEVPRCPNWRHLTPQQMGDYGQDGGEFAKVNHALKSWKDLRAAGNQESRMPPFECCLCQWGSDRIEASDKAFVEVSKTIENAITPLWCLVVFILGLPAPYYCPWLHPLGFLHILKKEIDV